MYVCMYVYIYDLMKQFCKQKYPSKINFCLFIIYKRSLLVTLVINYFFSDEKM